MLAIYLVSPAMPFLIWSFVAKLKKDKKPWLECCLLAICGIIYTGMLDSAIMLLEQLLL